MEIYADYFGCSLLTLFTQDNLEFETIEDEVEAFLYLLKKFIDSGLILVVSPLSGEKEKIIQNIKFLGYYFGCDNRIYKAKTS